MKCLLWKSAILLMALGVLMALGAFAEGSIGLPLACAEGLLACLGIRWAWGRAQQAERRAERRRRRAEAAARPVPQTSSPAPARGGQKGPEPPVPPAGGPREPLRVA